MTKLASSESRNYEALYGLLGELISQRPSAYWLEKLRAASIPIAAVNMLDAVAGDPHIREVGLFEQVTHPDLGEMTAVRSAIGFSRTPASLGKPAGRIGADTRQTLAEFGFSNAEIERLIEAKAAIQA